MVCWSLEELENHNMTLDQVMFYNIHFLFFTVFIMTPNKYPVGERTYNMKQRHFLQTVGLWQAAASTMT